MEYNKELNELLERRDFLKDRLKIVEDIHKNYIKRIIKKLNIEIKEIKMLQDDYMFKYSNKSL